MSPCKKTKLTLPLPTRSALSQENKDWITARSAACALKKIGRAQSLATAGNAKHIVVTDIIEKLCSVSLGSWSEVNFDGENAMAWFCAAEQAIDALFVISTCPEKESEKIIVGLKEVSKRSERALMI